MSHLIADQGLCSVRRHSPLFKKESALLDCFGLCFKSGILDYGILVMLSPFTFVVHIRCLPDSSVAVFAVICLHKHGVPLSKQTIAQLMTPRKSSIANLFLQDFYILSKATSPITNFEQILY